MKTKKPNAAQIWKQLEDHLVPRLRLSITDRAVYSHLLRHSRLEGRARLRFSMAWLARGARLSTNPARWAVRRLIAHGALRLVERGRCFYCLRRLTPLIRCLDHVVPRVSFGSNSYRNLVSCCLQCNSQKRDRSAGDFLRWLYRERRLTAVELAARLRALDALASGKLPPPLP